MRPKQPTRSYLFWRWAHRLVNDLAWRWTTPPISDAGRPLGYGEPSGTLWRLNDMLAERWMGAWAAQQKENSASWGGNKDDFELIDSRGREE